MAWKTRSAKRNYQRQWVANKRAKITQKIIRLIKEPFKDELEFQKYVKQNISKIDESYNQIADKVPINDGELDILAKDSNGNYSIIEVKLNASHYALSQVLFYINSFIETSNNNQISVNNIRSIIVGVTVQPSLIHAIKAYNSSIKEGFQKVELYRFDFDTLGFIDMLSRPDNNKSL